MTVLAVLTALLLQAPPAAAAAPVQAELPPIRKFLQVTPDFCTGAQPRVEHFAQLKSQGVKTVLNLRQPSEHRAEEEQAAVELVGMKYLNIPVAYGNPTDEQADAFLKITDDPANRPMFVHCTAAIRVGAFWLIRRVMRDGMAWDAALEEAATVGLVEAPHLEAFAKAYVASHKK
ncbi:MAG TPA: protein tyrosine phosphatase family protein [Vicinamibacterales bacterium]|nr:protein tyrosine phosphatase family protein [Vicinamibacterales bacterium]